MKNLCLWWELCLWLWQRDQRVVFSWSRSVDSHSGFCARLSTQSSAVMSRGTWRENIWEKRSDLCCMLPYGHIKPKIKSLLVHKKVTLKEMAPSNKWAWSSGHRTDWEAVCASHLLWISLVGDVPNVCVSIQVRCAGRILTRICMLEPRWSGQVKTPTPETSSTKWKATNSEWTELYQTRDMISTYLCHSTHTQLICETQWNPS